MTFVLKRRSPRKCLLCIPPKKNTMRCFYTFAFDRRYGQTRADKPVRDGNFSLKQNGLLSMVHHLSPTPFFGISRIVTRCPSAGRSTSGSAGHGSMRRATLRVDGCCAPYTPCEQPRVVGQSPGLSRPMMNGAAIYLLSIDSGSPLSQRLDSFFGAPAHKPSQSPSCDGFCGG